jgi:hypothetical protein
MVCLASYQGGVMSKEFDFFGDANISKLFDLVLQLGMDLNIANTRIRALEMQLIRNEELKVDDIDNFQPTDSEKLVLDKNRDEFMSRIIRIITETGPSEYPLRQQWEEAITKKYPEI